jgi:O-antigen ligase
MAPHRTAPAATAVLDPRWLMDQNDSMRRLALAAGVALTFIRFGFVHELIYEKVGFNTYILFVFGIPALLGVVSSGGVKRALAGKAAWYWLFFGLWSVICVPFSSWPGGSSETVQVYWRTQFPMLFVTGGLTVGWADCRRMINAIAASAIVILYIAATASVDYGGRLAISFGSIANSNDIAAFLLLLTPFVAYLGLAKSTKAILRPVCLAGIGFSAVSILSTASRGALLALAVMLAYLFWKLPGRQRMAMIALVALGGPIAVALTPDSAVNRLKTLFGAENVQEAEEAELSADAREAMLRKSFEYMIRNPIVGVGPAQFSVYDDRVSREEQGKMRGSWIAVHNSYTQAGAEMGFPGLITFLGGLFFTFRSLNRSHTALKGRPEWTDHRLAILCTTTGLVGFAVAIFFLNFTFIFVMPALAGLAIAIERAVNFELIPLAQAAAQSQAPAAGVALKSPPSAGPARTQPGPLPRPQPPTLAQPPANPQPAHPLPASTAAGPTKPRVKFGRFAPPRSSGQ